MKKARKRIVAQMTYAAEESKMGRTGGNFRETSNFNSTKSRMQYQSSISDSQRENYDGIIQKSKQREINLMNKMLKNEEIGRAHV